MALASRRRKKGQCEDRRERHKRTTKSVEKGRQETRRQREFNFFFFLYLKKNTYFQEEKIVLFFSRIKIMVLSFGISSSTISRNETYYTILEINHDATSQEIEDAYT